MGKTRVGVLLRESVAGNKNTGNRSADLAELSQKYQAYSRKLQDLIKALKEQQKAMVHILSTRAEVAQVFSDLTKNTPLWESIGIVPSADRPAATVCSYTSLHKDLGDKTRSFAVKYQQFVVDYVVEWHAVITKRIDAGWKTSEDLRRELDHYQKKVEAMRLSVNQIMSKGKKVADSTTEKLARNEEKLITSKQTYNKVATDLCILMEEVTDRGWRDLHPLLIKVAQFDSTLSGDEAKILSGLNQVVNQLKQIGSTNGISPQARLKDLSSLKPELLSTRPGGVSGLTIEAGSGLPSPESGTDNYSSYSAFDSSPMALPPGSVGAQGMGGFPVQVASPTYNTATTNQGSPSRTSSFSSFASQPSAPVQPTSYDPPVSTMSMLSVSQASAPPPTLEDVYSASHNSSNSLVIRSAPGSGNLPPLGPTGAYQRSNSYADESVYSNYTAAPVAAPPPPPGPSPTSYGAPQQPYMANGYASPPPQYQHQPPSQQYGAPSYGASPPATSSYGQQQQYQQYPQYPQSNGNTNPF